MLDLKCGNFDNSPLSQDIKINECSKCGHIYNEISLDEISRLGEYYNKEYAPINENAVYKTGGMPGGDSPLAFERYSKLFDFVRPYIKKTNKILDVGCANGGFLQYLNGQGFFDLYGIDPSEGFMREAKTKSKFFASSGSAEAIPFKDGMFDIVMIDNVIEHLTDPGRALREAKRVLKEDGLLYIGAPDAANYQKASFEFLWFLYKEHIQHFDASHLELLALREGFEMLACRQFDMQLTSKGAPLPAFRAIFGLSKHKNKPRISQDCLKLKEEMEKYVAESFDRLKEKRKMLDGISISKKPIYVWGIAAEFFYLYESIGLKNCNIVDLIDINPYKQKILTVDGRRIRPPSILKKASADSAVLICATVHTKEILDQLSELAYRGQIIKA